MFRSKVVTNLVRYIFHHEMVGTQPLSCGYSTRVQAQIANINNYGAVASLENQCHTRALSKNSVNSGVAEKLQIGENVSRKDKISFLVSTLLDLKDSQEVVYSALDAWVAWEQHFPIGSLKTVLLKLEKEQQWHRVIQVIKWMLSKGQGTTMGTYQQLIRALDMDHRAQEAHDFWVKKIGFDLHSVPWQLCNLMISVYYRNNMLDHLVKLFKGLEAFDRKPQEKSTVQKVADAYELLGLVEEKERVLEKYSPLFSEASKGLARKFRKTDSKKKGKSELKPSSNVECLDNDADGNKSGLNLG